MMIAAALESLINAPTVHKDVHRQGPTASSMVCLIGCVSSTYIVTFSKGLRMRLTDIMVRYSG
jgi:hypothetical protein